MSRYIDADALKGRVGELIVPEWARTLIRTWLESAPTVDAVPVVRCKECRWFKADEWVENAGYCISLNARIHPQITVEDWFCADGERRSE